MKKFLSTLLGVALVVSIVAPAFSDPGVIQFPRLKWTRVLGASQDSTRISIPAPATDGSVDNADTTQWFDVNAVRLPQTYTAQPLVWFQVNRQITATTDSIGFKVQYTNDLSTPTIFGTITEVAYVTGTATTQGITAGQDGYGGSVIAVSPATVVAHTVGAVATLPWRYVRLVVRNVESSSMSGRVYFSVTPVVYGSR